VLLKHARRQIPAPHDTTLADGDLAPGKDGMNRDSSAEDGALLERLAQGDLEALAALYDRYAPPVYHLLLALTSDPDTAADLLQETFLALLDKGRGARSIRSPQAYLLGVAHHLASRGRQRRRREQTLAAASTFLAKRCAFWQPGDRLTYDKYRGEMPQPLCVFGWEGPGPEEFTHRVKVSISSVTGEAVAYDASVDPPNLPAAKPVRLSADDAVQRVREMLPTLQPDTVGEAKVTVMGLRTGGTPCSLPGQPVYLVDLEGYKTPTGYAKLEGDAKPPDRTRLACYRIVYEVDASTGEILTKRVTLQDLPRPKAPQISADQALQIATSSAPNRLTEPTFAVSAMTNRCRVAPHGTFVYPMRLSGKMPAPDGSGERYEWAQTWAVDAQTGKVYGLGVRRANETGPAPTAG